MHTPVCTCVHPELPWGLLFPPSAACGQPWEGVFSSFNMCVSVLLDPTSPHCRMSSLLPDL